MPCSNPDCLYLHEIGSQEDSFTKDEIISAYTRSRVQQITGAAINMQRRSGNVLPPPLDDCMDNPSGKPIVKNSSSTSVSIVRGSPPNETSGRPLALSAAAWGTRATNCQPAGGGLLCTNELPKPKPDTSNSTLPFSSAVAGTIQASLVDSEVKKRPLSSDGSHSMTPKVKIELLKSVKQNRSKDILDSADERTGASDVSLSPVKLNNQLPSLPLARDSDRGSFTATNTTNSIDITQQPCSVGPEEAIISTSGEIENLSCELSSVHIDRNAQNKHYSLSKNSSSPDNVLDKSMQSQESLFNTDKFKDVMITNADSKAAALDNDVCNLKEQCDLSLDSQSKVLSATEVEDDVTTFDNQRLKDPEVVGSYVPESASFIRVSNHSSPHLLQHGEPFNVVNAGSLDANDKGGDNSLLHAHNICNGYSEKLISTSSNGFLHGTRNEQHIGRLVSDAVNIGSNAVMDKGESSIISNILSMEFDAWDDSLTSPESLAKLLVGNTNNQNGPLKKSSSWKVQSNNQSRFSFARQEESKLQANVYPSSGASHQFPKNGSLIQDFVERDFSLDKLGIANGFPSNNLEKSGNLRNDHFIAPNNKLSAVSRAQISAPPGFSVPNRAPPPGFSSLERMGQAFDSLSGNSLPDHSFLLRNSYQAPSNGNIGSPGDIEFMDPAILAVGKGRTQGARNSPVLDMRSNYPEQLNYFENEARVQLLMQRSLSPQQNLQFSDRHSFSQLGDSYGISSRLNQSQFSNMASFPQLSLQQSRNAVLSNGQLDGWNEVQNGNSLGVAELLRNERLGFNKFYSGYDESKYRMPNSMDLFNRTFGI